jgi:SRSO17 transposase
VRLHGFDYAVGIHRTTHMRRIGAAGRLGVELSAAALARTVPRRQRKTLHWREGTKATLSGRFSFCRVKTTHPDGGSIESREPQWLVIEWPATKSASPKFYLTTLPRRMSRKKIVETIKERWRTERMYEDLKGELGLDHFEGRSFPGWHHHVSVVLCCYAFVVAERVRAFPPQTTRQNVHDALCVAA